MERISEFKSNQKETNFYLVTKVRTTGILIIQEEDFDYPFIPCDLEG
jgi:hypothetical protein